MFRCISLPRQTCFPERTRTFPSPSFPPTKAVRGFSQDSKNKRSKQKKRHSSDVFCRTFPSLQVADPSEAVGPRQLRFTGKPALPCCAPPSMAPSKRQRRPGGAALKQRLGKKQQRNLFENIETRSKHEVLGRRRKGHILQTPSAARAKVRKERKGGGIYTLHALPHSSAVFSDLLTLRCDVCCLNTSEISPSLPLPVLPVMRAVV